MKSKYLNILLLASILTFSACNDEDKEFQNIEFSDIPSDLEIINGTDSGTSTKVEVPDETIEDVERIPTVILAINFNNEKLIYKNNWVNKIFNFTSGSLNDYFNQTSNSHFYLEKIKENYGVEDDSYIEVNLDYDHPNPENLSDFAYQKLTFDAFNEAKQYITDIFQYDKNNDGEISDKELSFIIIVAGDEQSVGSTSNSVWGNSYVFLDLESNLITVEGKTLNTKYGLFGEKHNNRQATIGIIAHEMSHAILNLPDLYNTDNGNLGVGPFCLMDVGLWNTTTTNPGASPKELSAYFKYKLNWVNSINIIENNTLEIKSSNTDNENILKLPVTDTEYFLIENISTEGYESGIEYYIEGFLGGLAVWHIDEIVISNNLINNSVNNNKNHKGIDLVDAKTNNIDSNILPIKEDLFYSGNIHILNDNSSPDNTKLYNGSNSNINITNISAPRDIMTLELN